jgi:hypothetical protein
MPSERSLQALNKKHYDKQLFKRGAIHSSW